MREVMLMTLVYAEPGLLDPHIVTVTYYIEGQWDTGERPGERF